MGPKLLESVKGVVGGVAQAAAGVAATVGNAAAGVGQAAAGVAAGVGSAIGGALGKLKFWATGTLNHPGGAAVINENGPELVTLPGGSKVMTAAATSNIFNSGLASIMAGLNKSALAPSMPPANSGMVTLVNKVTVKAEIDGREVGRAAYENLDRFALI
jgi:phage-related protein